MAPYREDVQTPIPRSRPVLRTAPSIDSINTVKTTKSRSRTLHSRAPSRASIYTFRSRAGTQSKSRRPTISGPSDFRMVSSATGNNPFDGFNIDNSEVIAKPEPAHKAVFRPLELTIHAPGGQLSPLPTFSPTFPRYVPVYQHHRTSSLSDIPSPISATFPSGNPHRRSLSAPIPVHTYQSITRKPLPARRDTIAEDEQESAYAGFQFASSSPSTRYPSFYSHAGASVNQEVRPPVPLKTALTLPSPIDDYPEPKSAFSSPSTAITGTATFSPLTDSSFELASSPSHSIDEKEWLASPARIAEPSTSPSKLIASISRSISNHVPHFPRRQLTYTTSPPANYMARPVSTKRPITAPHTVSVPTHVQLLAQKQRHQHSEIESISCPSLISGGRSRGTSDSTVHSDRTFDSNVAWGTCDKNEDAWGRGLGVEFGVAY